MEGQLVPVGMDIVFYESHMLSLLSANPNQAYNYLELGTYLKMSRKQAKNIARRLKLQGKVIIRPMKGQRKVRCGFARGADGIKRPSYKDKDIQLAYVMIDKSWLGAQLPPETPAVQKVI